MKKLIILILFPLLDLIFSPLVLLSAMLLLLVRRAGVYRLKISRNIFNLVGVFPVRDHYYEPLFNPVHLRHPLDEIRYLPGLKWNAEGQLALLAQFDFNEELKNLSKDKDLFDYENPNFRAGDAEFLYNIIRLYRPGRIVEIGSGASTLLAHAAVEALRKSDPAYACHHICIEPYEMQWLENISGIEVKRDIVENIPLEFFSSLESGDVLFIDSSHVIRPQGDVLREYLQILPSLKPGVLIHVHDIFSPRDYPEVWLVDQVRLWNEQYLLEAFLSCNEQFEIIGALNYLKYTYPAELSAKCPIFALNPTGHEPGSFWIRKK